MTGNSNGNDAITTIPLSGASLSEGARKALEAAIDALTGWRAETAESYAKNSELVFGKMSAAAKAMGWPSDFVDAIRQQMLQASKIQLQAMDQIMDAWEQQMKAQGTGFPTAWGAPRYDGIGEFPAMSDFSNDMSRLGMMNPILFWMQAADMWQKNWNEGLRSWTDMQRSALERTIGGNGLFRTH